MKKYLKTLLIVMILVITISFAGIVSAATAGMALSSSSKLSANGKVEVTLRIQNVTATGDGIDSIVATLDYDKTVFEEVTQSNLVGLNDWVVNLYSPDTQILTLTRPSKVAIAGDVLKITLTAKSTVNVNSTDVKLKSITASGGAIDMGGTGDIEIKDVKVTVSKEDASKPPVQNTITNNGTTQQTNNTATRLPQTGDAMEFLVIGVVAFVILAIVAYLQYKKNSDIT